MRILTVTWEVYEPYIDTLQRDKTGGGILIRNLAQKIGKKCDSYVMIGSVKLSGGKYDNVEYVKTDDVEDVIVPNGDFNQIRLLTMERAFDRALKDIKPSVVNVHGKGDFALYCLQKCIEKNVPCVYTEHLFICKDASFGGYEKDVVMEDRIFTIPNIKVIAVSTAMRNNILSHYNLKPENVSVILNGTDLNSKPLDKEFAQRFGIKGYKVLVCSGTILDRKNQKQLISVYKQLPSHIKKELKILFCGKDTSKGRFYESIKKEGLSDHLIYAGVFSNEDMMRVYSISDGMVMPSLCEGLSVAALEMLSFGKPVIMYEDVEGASDLHDEDAVIFAHEHTDTAFVDAISRWWDKKWDKDYIKKFASYFSLERMAEYYINYYKNMLKEVENE